MPRKENPTCRIYRTTPPEMGSSDAIEPAYHTLAVLPKYAETVSMLGRPPAPIKLSSTNKYPDRPARKYLITKKKKN